MSRFYPTILTANTLKKLGVNLEALAGRARPNGPKFADRFQMFHGAGYDSAEMGRMADAGLNRLYNFQHQDGGWGWWPDDASSPYITAYVLTGLQITGRAGQTVRPQVLENGYYYLLQALNPQTRQSIVPAGVDSIQTEAYIAYVLSWAAAHKGQPGGLDPQRFNFETLAVVDRLRRRLYEQRSTLNSYGLALLALALHHAGEERAGEVLHILLRQAQRNAKEGTANVAAATQDWWRWYNSDVETNAWALRATLAIDPGSELASGLARWLALHRQNGTHWRSTRDSALAVAALADYVLTQKGSGADCRVTVRLDGRPVHEVTIGSKDLLAPDRRLILDAAKLPPGPHTVTLEKSGRGDLQFSGRFRTFAKQDTIEQSGKGLALKREYFSLGADGATRKPLASNAGVAVGDIIEVVLTIDAGDNYDYLAFADPKPAGCEPVQLQSGGLWLDWSWANVELRDQRVVFFLSYLNRGQHVLRYRLRAETPGAYRVLPASGFAMYAPEIQATSAGRRLGIRDK